LPSSPRTLPVAEFGLVQFARSGHSLNCRPSSTVRIGSMGPFIYRCPATGLSVQGWIADDPSEGEAETYEAVTCTACTRVHLVNPETGRVLGTGED
jgi:hypothetical protein